MLAQGLPGTPWSWETDYRSGRSGFFYSGGSGEPDLYRVFRFDADPWGRRIFTLAPVRLSAACVDAEFKRIQDDRLRGEVENHYRELSTSIRAGSCRAAVTSAKQVVEVILQAKYPGGGDLRDKLKKVKAELEGGGRDGCEWDDLAYHLAQKLRILHGRIHADQVGKNGRSYRPELAMTVAEDLNEILIRLGFA